MKLKELNRDSLLAARKPLVLDGPTGTYLIEKGIVLKSALWSAEALISHSDLIKQIHIEYIEAGADIITTNTFRTNPYAIKLSKSKYQSKDLVNIAVNLVKEAVTEVKKDIIIAGSNAPAEDCYSRKHLIDYNEIYDNHYEHIENLISAGVDFILNETFGDVKEIEIVCKICKEKNFPFAVSILIDKNLKTFFGQDLLTTIKSIYSYKPFFISLNCSRPEIILKALNHLINFHPLGVYPNLGSSSSFPSQKLVRDFSEQELKDFVYELINKGTRIIGVCCGGNPKDIKIIRKIIDEL